MKKIIPEAILIVVVAGLLAIVNNIFADKPLPLIPKPEKSNPAPDSALFGKARDNYLKEPLEVSYSQIVKLLNDTNVQFLDARNPADFAKAHIGNAINIFPDMDDQGKYLEMVNQLPRNKILIVYCDGGACDLSHELAKTLFEFDYKQSFIYKGGWEEWSVLTDKRFKIENRK